MTDNQVCGGGFMQQHDTILRAQTQRSHHQLCVLADVHVGKRATICRNLAKTNKKNIWNTMLTYMCCYCARIWFHNNLSAVHAHEWARATLVPISMVSPIFTVHYASSFVYTSTLTPNTTECSHPLSTNYLLLC